MWPECQTAWQTFGMWMLQHYRSLYWVEMSKVRTNVFFIFHTIWGKQFWAYITFRKRTQYTLVIGNSKLLNEYQNAILNFCCSLFLQMFVTIKIASFQNMCLFIYHKTIKENILRPSLWRKTFTKKQVHKFGVQIWTSSKLRSV